MRTRPISVWIFSYPFPLRSPSNDTKNSSRNIPVKKQGWRQQLPATQQFLSQLPQLQSACTLRPKFVLFSWVMHSRYFPQLPNHRPPSRFCARSSSLARLAIMGNVTNPFTKDKEGIASRFREEPDLRPTGPIAFPPRSVTGGASSLARTHSCTATFLGVGRRSGPRL
jgi:hypothetical protein